MRLAYVILHYMAGEDTIECAESILKVSENSNHNVLIIIVDNGSTNHSIDKINEAFGQSSSVVILRSEKNLGFARGNNLGFTYAKKIFKADFIVQLNNDTIISQSDFNDVIIRKYEETNYDVLGPDIVTADGYHQNPGRKQFWTLRELSWFRFKKRIRILLSYLYIDSLLEKGIKQVKEIYRKDTLVGDVKDTILHGACLIFSPKYINRFNGLCGDTFLYFEEDILKMQADYYGLIMLYSSELSIYHKEDVATNFVLTSFRSRERRKYRLLIESSKVYSKIKAGYIKNIKH